MARLFVDLAGWQLHLELGRPEPEPDPEPDEDAEEETGSAADLSGGDLGSYRLGFTKRDPTPYDADFPDRY